MIDIEKIIDDAKKLFPFPAVAKRLILALEEEMDVKQITAIASLDPSIVSNIIAVANSPFYAARKKITDLTQATVRIGFETVRQIAITKSFSNLFSRTDLTDKLLWEHSVAVSILNKQLAIKIGKISESTAGIIGLLHDFGKSVLKKSAPKDYDIAFEQFYNGNKEMRSIELDILGVSHDYIIGKLSEAWNLGDTMTVALSHHHGPYETGENRNDYAIITAISDAIVNNNAIGRRNPAGIDIEETEPFKLLGISIDEIRYVEEKGLKEFLDTINLL